MYTYVWARHPRHTDHRHRHGHSYNGTHIHATYTHTHTWLSESSCATTCRPAPELLNLALCEILKSQCPLTFPAWNHYRVDLWEFLPVLTCHACSSAPRVRVLCVSVCVWWCVCVVCVCVCMSIHIYICMLYIYIHPSYIHTHTHTLSLSHSFTDVHTYIQTNIYNITSSIADAENCRRLLTYLTYIHAYIHT
jgi:hypothetical protein